MNGDVLEQPLEQHTSNRRLFLTILVVVIASIVILSAIALYLAPPKPSAPRIVSVSVSPNPGLPYSLLTVEVVAEADSGHPSVSLAFATCFAMNSGGGSSMQRVGGNRYTTQIGPFYNGTEVWLVVAAFNGDQWVVNSGLSVSVGTIVRDGPSGLDISGVSHTPQTPRVEETVVINATVTSSSNVDYVELLFAHVSATQMSSASRSMPYTSSANYSIEIDNPFLFGYVYEKGSFFIYRFAATDESTNTALSDVGSFTWS